MAYIFIFEHGLPEISYRGRATTADIAAWLGVSPATLRYWRNKGKGPKFDKWGAKFLYRIEYIQQYMADVCTFLQDGSASGLIPFKGTMLEEAARKLQAIESSDTCADLREPKSADRPATVLLVNDEPLSVTMSADFRY